MKILNREPVLFLAALHAVVTAAVVFGWSLSVKQVGAIDIAAAAILSVIARANVTPVDASHDA